MRNDRALLAVAAAALAGVLAGFGFAPGKAEEPGAPIVPVVDFSRSYGTLTAQYLTTSDPHQPEGAAVFLGDSHTQGLAVAAVADRAVNYGIGGLTSERLLLNLPALGAVKRARVVFLMIGSNDGEAKPENYARLAEAIPGELVWHAIPPNPRWDVTGANEAIADACEDRGRCRFVQTDLGAGDFQADNSHLSAAGYGKLIATLRATNPPRTPAQSATPPGPVR